MGCDVVNDEIFKGLTGQQIFDKIEAGETGSFQEIPGDLVVFREFGSEPFRTALEAFKSEGNSEKVKEMEYEIVLFDFTMKNPVRYSGEKFDRFSPKFVYTNGQCYPDIEKVSEEAKQYYKMRGQQTQNLELKVRYCDFTWEYLKAHEHARMAVESYLLLLDSYYENKYYFGISNYLPRSLQIAAQLDDESLIRKCVDAHLKYLEIYTDNKQYRWLHELLESILMLKRCKEFIDFESIDSFFQIAIEGCGYDVINKVELIKNRIQLLKIYGKKDLIGKAQEDIAIAYEVEADRYKTNPLIASDYLDKSIKHYDKINGQYGADYTTKLDSLKIKIKQVNRDVKSHMQTISAEAKIPVEQIEEYVTCFRPLSIENCLILIASEFPIMLSLNQAIEIAKDSLQDTPLLASITETVMSDDNISGEIEAGEQKIEKFAKQIIINNCFSTIQLFICPVFDLLLREKDLTPKELLGFLSNSHLIEKERLPIIKVGIERFFSSDYLSSIHILVFQIEGILRDVLDKLGRPTTRSPKRGSTQEKLLDEILRDEKLKKNLKEDFCYFLQVVLSDPLGVNLRNRVGHALAKFGEFDRATGMLLLLILMKFGILIYSKTEKVPIDEQPDSKKNEDT